MEYEELIDCGKRLFNFHPDEPFDSPNHLLDTAKKSVSSFFYTNTASIYAEYLAKYIDQLSRIKD